MLKWMKAFAQECWEDDWFTRTALLLGVPSTLLILGFLVWGVGSLIMEEPVAFLITILGTLCISGFVMLVSLFDSYSFQNAIERRLRDDK